MSSEFGKVLRPTIIYLVVLSSLMWFLYIQTIETPSELTAFIPGFELNQLLLPLVAVASSFYASTLMEKLTQGRLSGQVSDSIYRLGLTLPLYFIGQWPQTPSFFVSILSLPLLINFSQALLNPLDIYLDQYKKFSRPIIGGVKIALIGFFLINSYKDVLVGLRVARDIGEIGPRLDSILYYVHGDSLIDVFRLAIILTMVASFSAVLRENYNPYLAYLGDFFGENLFSKFLVFFILASYFSFLRGELVTGLGENWQFLSLFEWGLLCILFYRGYKAINRYAEVFVDKQEMILKWTRHVQDIKFTTDQKLDNLSSLVKGFIERGEKILLEVNLVGLMASYHYSPSRIHLTLREFLEYEDKKPGPLAFNWQVNYLENVNKENRRNLMAKTFENLEGHGLIMREEPVESDENNEVILNESERIAG